VEEPTLEDAGGGHRVRCFLYNEEKKTFFA